MKFVWGLFFLNLITLPAYATPIKFDHIQAPSTNLHYAYAGKINKPGILFIHGTPGKWSAFKDYLSNEDLQQDFFMVSVDRLGWGESTLENANYETSFKRHSNAISGVLSRYPDKQWIVVGHSYGASLAPTLTLSNQDKVSGLLLLAGSFSPKLGEPRWYNSLANSLLLGWVVRGGLKKSNHEIMDLSSELELQEQQLATTPLEAQIVVIQGGKDKLVSPSNISYVKQYWQENQPNLKIIELPDAGHFLPWKQTDMIVKQIHFLNKKNRTKSSF